MDYVLLALLIFLIIGLIVLFVRLGGNRSDPLLIERTRQVEQLQKERESLLVKCTALETLLAAERESSEEKLALLTEARESLGNQFKVVASSIFEQQTKQFSDLNRSSMDSVLAPFKEKLGEFQKKAESMYETEGKERFVLAAELKRLMELNVQLSSDATNLTRALKGDSKLQGNWGEMILERILEVSGLQKGIHFDTQEQFAGENGNRLIPDVTILLPEERFLIVDSKVSLVAYDEHCCAENDVDRTVALNRHIQSLKNHIAGLSSKEYQKLHGHRSPDFVILFIPIEPAFIAAVSANHSLWEEAWKKNILLVSPSTLLFVLRIVSQLWTQANQTENAREISRRGAELYDKLASFVADFEKIGVQIGAVQKTYDDSFKKLSSGRGNAIRQAELLKQLGVSPSKSIAGSIVDQAFLESE